MRTKGQIGNIEAFVIPLALLIFFLPQVFTSNNNVIYSHEGDGFKNLFTPAYYVKYDSGKKFSGMNHPYGELVTFTDNQPFFSWVLQKANIILPVEDHLFTILNLLLIFGIALCAFLMYRIFIFYGIPRWASLWLGMIVTALAPQLDRIDAHFAMAYVFFIPLTWWLMIQVYQSDKKFKWLIFLGLNIFLQSWIHLYFLLINSLFVGAWAFVHYFRENGWTWNRNASSLQLIISLGISAMLVLLTVKGIDPIDDRPENPYGVSTYVTTIQSVVYPNKGPLKPIIDPGNVVGEGEGYLGLSSIPFIFIALALIYRHKKMDDDFLKENIKSYSFFVTSIITGVIVFLYATGWLNAIGLKYVNDFVPPLKQFRSIGRLVWIVYFMFLPAMLIITFKYWQLWKADVSQYGLSLIPLFGLLFWSVEGVFYFQSHTRNLAKQNTFEINEQVDQIKEIISQNDLRFEDFQASLGLPITILGPERLQIDRGIWNMRILMPLAYQTGLPMMDIMMSRTSNSQALDMLELFTPPYVPKQRLASMTEQPVLVLFDENIATDYEKEFAARCQVLGQKGSQKWLRAEKSTWYDSQMNQMIRQSYQDTIKPSFHKSFDEGGEEVSFAGSSSSFLDGTMDTLWRGSVPSGVIHELTFWLHLDHQTTCLPNVHFYKMSEEGKILYKTHFDYGQQALTNNGWVRVVWFFDTPGVTDEFMVTVDGCKIKVDELLVKRRDENVYSISGNDTLYNNYYLDSAR